MREERRPNNAAENTSTTGISWIWNPLDRRAPAMARPAPAVGLGIIVRNWTRSRPGPVPGTGRVCLAVELVGMSARASQKVVNLIGPVGISCPRRAQR